MNTQIDSPKSTTQTGSEPLSPATRIITIEKDTSPLLTPAIEDDVSLDTLMVVFEADQFENIVVPVGKTILVGREHASNAAQPELDLTAHDGLTRGVSRLHASVRHAADGWWLTDLGSSNGSWINGERMAPRAPCHLEAVSRVRLGRLDFHLIVLIR